MGNLIVYNVFIPNEDRDSGRVHQRTKFDSWSVTTAEQVGLVMLVHERAPRLFFRGEELQADECHWFRVTVDSDRLADFHAYIRSTAALFGEASIPLERAGEIQIIEG